MLNDSYDKNNYSIIKTIKWNCFTGLKVSGILKKKRENVIEFIGCDCAIWTNMEQCGDPEAESVL